MKRTFSINKIFYILAVAIVLGFLYNQFSPRGIGLVREEVKLKTYNGDSTATTQPDYSKIQAVKIDDAYNFYKKGVTFIDARDMWEFSEGHIKGAINFPYVEFEAEHLALEKLKKDERLIIYCSSDECGLSTKLAEELQKLGFQKLFVFEEGWDAWLERGYPTETSELE